jgi:hypothetical protein
VAGYLRGAGDDGGNAVTKLSTMRWYGEFPLRYAYEAVFRHSPLLFGFCDLRGNSLCLVT